VKRWGKEARPAKCKHCGKDFLAVQTHLGWMKFCSQACQGASRRKRSLFANCKVCGVEFRREPPGRKLTCSVECTNAAKSIAKSGARNPNFLGENKQALRWASQRDVACVSCGAPDRLQLHHVVYAQEVRRRGGDAFDPRDSLTLCLPCHTRHHRLLKEQTVDLKVLRDVNYEFAVELMGLGPAYEYLRRRYCGTDERLDALLVEERVA
jgi:hypothetical protein